jgi:predicted NUDIX family NTP pyrophosphohydrolase
VYPGSKDVKRFPVPDDKVSWKVDWPEYKPVDYTADVVTKQPPWADIDVRSDKAGPLPKYNEIDGKVDRRSFEGKYDVVDRVPRNPIGRTGIVGRGLLGRWGPNHAADPIVTRWKRNQSGEIEKKGGLQVLEFVAIKRRDNGAWAIPGGMVEPGDNVSATLKKEFGEEAMNFLEASDDEKQKIEEQIGKLFHGGEKIYEGYVDDPRNTDNSWMETVAMNFHDATGEACGKIKLHAGDDAGDVSWKEISKDLQLFASHQDFVKRVAKRHNAAY